MEKGLVVRDPSNLRLWAERIAECRNSGENITQWCQQHGISPKTYYYWNKRVKNLYAQENTGASGFYEVPQVYTSASVAAIVVGNIRTEVYQGADAETLSAIIKAIQQC